MPKIQVICEICKQATASKVVCLKHYILANEHAEEMESHLQKAREDMEALEAKIDELKSK